nr:basic proline-rich protein-like [Aegilops tauschii subsp. strangulata]
MACAGSRSGDSPPPVASPAAAGEPGALPCTDEPSVLPSPPQSGPLLLGPSASRAALRPAAQPPPCEVLLLARGGRCALPRRPGRKARTCREPVPDDVDSAPGAWSAVRRWARPELRGVGLRLGLPPRRRRPRGWPAAPFMRSSPFRPFIASFGSSSLRLRTLQHPSRPRLAPSTVCTPVTTPLPTQPPPPPPPPCPRWHGLLGPCPAQGPIALAGPPPVAWTCLLRLGRSCALGPMWPPQAFGPLRTHRPLSPLPPVRSPSFPRVLLPLRRPRGPSRYLAPCPCPLLSRSDQPCRGNGMTGRSVASVATTTGSAPPRTRSAVRRSSVRSFVSSVTGIGMTGVPRVARTVAVVPAHHRAPRLIGAGVAPRPPQSRAAAAPLCRRALPASRLLVLKPGSLPPRPGSTSLLMLPPRPLPLPRPLRVALRPAAAKARSKRRSVVVRAAASWLLPPRLARALRPPRGRCLVSPALRASIAVWRAIPKSPASTLSAAISARTRATPPFCARIAPCRLSS